MKRPMLTCTNVVKKCVKITSNQLAENGLPQQIYKD